MATISTLTFPSGRRLEKITSIKESPTLSFYTAEEHVTDSVDDFHSSEETVRPVWLAISNQADDKTLQLWKDWSRSVKGSYGNGNDNYGVECKEAAIIDNRLAAVLSLDDAQLTEKFPDANGESFVSSLCYMAIQLDGLGFSFKNWNWSNIVQIGDYWKLTPSLSMERTSASNPKQALTRLGKWLTRINAPFLQTQPARSIVEMIASGRITDAFPEEIIYEEFWKPLSQDEEPLQLSLTQSQNTIRLEWESTSGEVLLLHTNGKKKAQPGQYIWSDDIEQYGTPLTEVSGINQIIDSDAGTAQWNRPQDNSKYQTMTITPAVRRDNWFELGVPVVVGGPEEANLLGAYYDNDSKEIVLSPSWSDDKNVTKLYVVVRQDRFAQNIHDAQPDVPPFIIERRLINHPIRKRIKPSSQYYVVIYNAVTVGNKVYFSAGQADSCRKTILNACR
ncbi:MAG: hypothetical protein IKS45_01935 [Thermoguttaceae bacterium]|nr:hypothetical protein [Thermoguttaceae bacterium]